MNKNNVIIGMGQLLVEGGEPDRNLQRACEMAKEASRKGCDILLLPECLDLTWTHPSARMEAQPIPGPFSDKLCQFAKDYNIYICGGLTEKCNDKVYNAAILINNYGEIILKYRKINVLVCAQEFYSIGNSLSVVNTPFGIIGVNICSDNYIDSLEIGHTLARMGAQILLASKLKELRLHTIRTSRHFPTNRKQSIKQCNDENQSTHEHWSRETVHHNC